MQHPFEKPTNPDRAHLYQSLEDPMAHPWTEPPADFSDRVMAAIATVRPEQASVPDTSRTAWLIAAVAAVVMTAIVLFSWGGSDEPAAGRGDIIAELFRSVPENLDLGYPERALSDEWATLSADMQAAVTTLTLGLPQ